MQSAYRLIVNGVAQHRLWLAGRARRRRRAVLKRVHKLLEIGLRIPRENEKDFLVAGLLVEDVAVAGGEGITVEAFHIIAAACDFRGRKHRLPRAARTLAHDVKVARPIRLHAELDLIARVEN